MIKEQKTEINRNIAKTYLKRKKAWTKMWNVKYVEKGHKKTKNRKIRWEKKLDVVVKKSNTLASVLSSHKKVRNGVYIQVPLKLKRKKLPRNFLFNLQGKLMLWAASVNQKNYKPHFSGSGIFSVLVHEALNSEQNPKKAKPKIKALCVNVCVWVWVSACMRGGVCVHACGRACACGMCAFLQEAER